MIAKIFYINLDHRKDRREHIENQLKACGLFDISERITATLNEKNGMMGCVESHIRTLKRIISEGHENSLIIEDDLKIREPEKLKGRIESIFERNIDFDIMQISGNVILSEETEFADIRKVIDSQTTSGYIINRKFVGELLENFSTSLCMMKRDGRLEENCLDRYWKILQPSNNWFTFSPTLGYQRDDYSDIEKLYMNYKV